MVLGRLGSKIALGRLDTRQNGSESENTRHFGCEAQVGALALGRTHHFTYTPCVSNSVTFLSCHVTRNYLG